MCVLPAHIPSTPGARRFAARALTVLAIAALAFYALIAVAAIASNWYFYDARGYWDTAVSLRDGAELYPVITDPDDPFVYRYAPWFALAWVPLTYLPEPAVLVGWGVVLAAASFWMLWQLPRNLTGLALALVFGPMLLRVVSQGNVQPLMVAALVWGLSRRSGPVWIGLAASLKIVPIGFAAVYVARRQWARAAVSAILAALLWLPALAFGLDNYPTQVGGEAFPFGWLTFVIATAALAAVFLLPDRYRALAAGLAVTFGSPRWIPYNPSYVLVAVPPLADPGNEPSRQDAH